MVIQISHGSKSAKGADGLGNDAFSRRRTSSPLSIFGSHFLWDKGPSIVWDESVTGTATVAVAANNGARLLYDTPADGDEVIRQTKRSFPYRPGLSNQIPLTFVLGAAQTGARRRIGFFDALDGLFLEREAGEPRLVLRSSVNSGAADDSNAVAQSAWNRDPFDGTGPSGITVDWTKQQILLLDLQWLGSGRVRAALDIDGIAYEAHEWRNANENATAPYMRTATLPIRIEQTATAAGVTVQLQQICSAVIAEGLEGFPGFITGIDTHTTLVNVANGAMENVLAVRLRADRVASVAQILQAQIANHDANTAVHWELQVDPVFASPLTWVNGDTETKLASSRLEYSTSNIAVTTEGHPLAAGTAFPAKNSAASPIDPKVSDFALGHNIDGSAVVVAIVAESFSGTVNTGASMLLRELD